jgi:hypothetical protein
LGRPFAGSDFSRAVTVLVLVGGFGRAIRLGEASAGAEGGWAGGREVGEEPWVLGAWARASGGGAAGLGAAIEGGVAGPRGAAVLGKVAGSRGGTTVLGAVESTGG